MPSPTPGPVRRDFLRTSLSAGAGLALGGPRLLAQAPFDLVVRGGTIADGTGGQPFAADLGIVADRIAAIGRIAPEQGRRIIDATGLHVAPGFIDIHTHSDADILTYRTADSRVRQGVTTEVTGNCGSSAAPRGREPGRPAAGEDGPSWTDVASYCDVLDRSGLSVNHALLLGQGTLRRNAIGLADRPLTDDELAAVLQAVDEGLAQGAFGLSTGLEYTPGRYTPPAEITAMARVVARHGALYASHIRDEESVLLDAVDEAIQVGRATGVRVQVSHLKAAGRPNWGKQQGALDLIASARRDGVLVMADAYPYTAYATSLTILFPAAALEGGMPALLPRLRDAEWRTRIRRDIADKMAAELGDYGLLVVSSVRTPGNQALVGKAIPEIAATWTVDALDAILRLVEEEQGAVGIIGHGMSPENVDRVLRHPLVMIGSDGSSMAPVGRAAQTRPHPRSYGTFARVLGHYVRERRLFDVAEAVRKMTSMPADQVGLRDRGRIARGMKADLVLFDAATVRDRATFDAPHQFADGMPHVIVNGVAVVEHGAHTGATPGRALRRT